MDYFADGGKEEFKKILRKQNAWLSEDSQTEIFDQVTSAMENTENSDVIFIFVENEDVVVTAIHVPKESINDASGPIVMRGKTDKSIIAVFSSEYILDRIQKSGCEEVSPGLLNANDEKWISELENLAEMIMLEVSLNPPQTWSEMLDEQQGKD